MKIAVVVGSTRPGRKGLAVGQWIMQQASTREGATYELVDVAEFDLDLLNEPTVPGAANRQYENPKTAAWSRKIDEFDAYIWVTPEYNHSVPAAMKNAFDVIAPEWSHKAAGLVGYGADGGVRAVEHWRTIMANAHLVAVRPQLALSIFTDWQGETFAPIEMRTQQVTTLLDNVEGLGGLLATGRAARGA